MNQISSFEAYAGAAVVDSIAIAIIAIVTDDGERIHLNLRERVHVNKGDYVKVEYLPNTRRGTIYD